MAVTNCYTGLLPCMINYLTSRDLLQSQTSPMPMPMPMAFLISSDAPDFLVLLHLFVAAI